MEIKTAIRKLKKVAHEVEFATRDDERLKNLNELCKIIVDTKLPRLLLMSARSFYACVMKEAELREKERIQPWPYAFTWRKCGKQIANYISVMEREQ